VAGSRLRGGSARGRRAAASRAPGAPGAPAAASARPSTEDAIRADPRLSDDQKAALIAVYRSMLHQRRHRGGGVVRRASPGVLPGDGGS
jgi:hypothetical protein